MEVSRSARLGPFPRLRKPKPRPRPPTELPSGNPSLRRSGGVSLNIYPVSAERNLAFAQKRVVKLGRKQVVGGALAPESTHRPR